MQLTGMGTSSRGKRQVTRDGVGKRAKGMKVKKEGQRQQAKRIRFVKKGIHDIEGTGNKRDNRAREEQRKQGVKTQGKVKGVKKKGSRF